ncbi:hypothetical protein ACLB2K_063272 [Fragaria x ananassa]
MGCSGGCYFGLKEWSSNSSGLGLSIFKGGLPSLSGAGTPDDSVIAHSSLAPKNVGRAVSFSTWPNYEEGAESAPVTAADWRQLISTIVTFLTGYGINLLHSIPYYAQSNGQAEASNKAYRTSKRARGPTDTTPYALMFDHDAILPLEVHVASLRVQEQHQLLVIPFITPFLLIPFLGLCVSRIKYELEDI